MGQAIKNEITPQTTTSLFNSNNKSVTFAPFILRIPISFILRCVE